MGNQTSGGGTNNPTVAEIIAEVARSLGIPPAVALAIAYHESGLNPTIAGDSGHSIGLYQLYDQGLGAGMTVAQREDPRRNATIALTHLATVAREHPDWDWGKIAAVSQNPADHPAYRSSVNGLLDGFKSSGQHAVEYFTSRAPAGAAAVNDSGGTSARHYLNSNQEIQSQYGYLSAYLNDPEIGPILRKAAEKGWSTNRLLGALEKTDWWKHTSQTAREMQALQRTDPASYKEQWQAVREQVGALANSMGLDLHDKRLDHLATTALWSNWSSLQLQHAVGAEFEYKPGARLKGTAGKDVQQFKQMAGSYLVPISDQRLEKWTRQSLEGRLNPDDMTGYLAQQAKTLFPWMSDAIDRGIAPNDYLDPYRQAAAQTLEIDPQSVDFTDHKWRHLFEAQDDKGQRTERGLANAMTLMRTDPRYGFDYTQGARNEAAAFAQQLAQSFGFSA